jgi:Thioesterase superfamily
VLVRFRPGAPFGRASATHFSMNWLRPGVVRRFIAKGTTVRAGRKQIFARAELFAEDNRGERSLIATGDTLVVPIDRQPMLNRCQGHFFPTWKPPAASPHWIRTGRGKLVGVHLANGSPYATSTWQYRRSSQISELRQISSSSQSACDSRFTKKLCSSVPARMIFSP